VATFTFAVIGALLVVGVVLFFVIRLEIRTAQDQTIKVLLDMLRKGHGYSDPSAAAVVTASPAPAPVEPAGPFLPEPAVARSVLPAPAVEVAPPPEAPAPRSEPRPVSRADRAARQLGGEIAEETSAETEEADRKLREALHRHADAQADERGALARERRTKLPPAPPAPVEPEGERPSDVTHVYTTDDRTKMLRGVKIKPLPPGKAPPPPPRPIKSPVPPRPTVVDAGAASARTECPTTARTGTPVPPRPPSSPPAPPSLRGLPAGMDDRIADRYVELCEASLAAGKPANHCKRDTCMQGDHPDFGSCLCPCGGCRRAIGFLLQAQQENPASRGRSGDAGGAATGRGRTLDGGEADGAPSLASLGTAPRSTAASRSGGGVLART
jgi:hypothetical protein